MDKVAFTICYYRHTITKKTGNSKIDKKNNYIYTFFCESHLISTTHMYFIIHTITKISENSEIAKITNYIYLFLRGRFNFKNSFVCFYNMFFYIQILIYDFHNVNILVSLGPISCALEGYTDHVPHVTTAVFLMLVQISLIR